LAYGSYLGFIYQKPVEEIIAEFEYVQKTHNKKGSRICHYVSHISPYLFAEMNNDFNLLYAYASACCKYLFDLGHQACFAIHCSDPERLHIHFAINTTNYKNGHKLRQHYKETRPNIEEPLCNLIATYTNHPKEVGSIDELNP
jgi:hypothetical protein